MITRPTLTITRGLPGSGKTTWARHMAHGLLKSGWTADEEAQVTIISHWAIAGLLDAGHHVICDDTNLVPEHLEQLRLLAEEAGAKFVIKDFTDVPVDLCVERDAARAEPVSEDVIRGMHATWLEVVIVTGAAARVLMEPYLGSAEVELALDSPCADEPGKAWLVATIGGRVAGWSAAVPVGGVVKLATSYVLPEHRRRGVYRALFAARLEMFAGRDLVGWAADESLPVYLENGFTAVADDDSPTGHHWTEVRLYA